MDENQFKAFLDAIKSNKSLQDDLKKVSDLDSILRIAKGAGFAISAEDLSKSEADLSDEELEGVSGGWKCGTNHWLNSICKLWD